MPPHPGAFIHKDIYNKVGLYDKKFKIAGDFDFFVKCFIKNRINFKKINFITTRMRTGGISGKNIFSRINSSFEISNSLKDNKIKSSFFNHISCTSCCSYNFFRKQNAINNVFIFSFSNYFFSK